MLPNKRKPVAGKATGFQNTEMLPSKFDVQEDTRTACNLQAARLRKHFAMSWPVARVVASLAYGETH